jgi:hypothetical protein
MTRPHTDPERQLIVQAVAGTFGIRCTAGHTVSHLRKAMEARMDDVLQGTDYDRAGGRSADTTSTTERSALMRDGDKAHDDMLQMDRDLEVLREIERRWYAWSLRYVTTTPRKAEEKPTPGKGQCPPWACENCWRNEHPEPRGERWKGLCDVCGRWRQDHGERLIKPLHDIRFRHGKARVTTADLRKHAPHLLPQSEAS